MDIPLILLTVGLGLMTVHKIAPEKLGEWPAWLAWTIGAAVWAF